MTPNVRPVGDRILVESVQEKENKGKKGEIIIPDTAKEKPMESLVVALGTGKTDDKGKKIPFDVKKLDRYPCFCQRHSIFIRTSAADQFDQSHGVVAFVDEARYNPRHGASSIATGNDNYGADGKARWEVDLVRQWLKNTGIEELGFGLSADSHTWALLVRADSQHYQTDVGRAFQMEMLKASLDDALRGAWRTACELTRNPRAQPSG